MTTAMINNVDQLAELNEKVADKLCIMYALFDIIVPNKPPSVRKLLSELLEMDGDDDVVVDGKTTMRSKKLGQKSSLAKLSLSDRVQFYIEYAQMHDDDKDDDDKKEEQRKLRQVQQVPLPDRETSMRILQEQDNHNKLLNDENDSFGTDESFADEERDHEERLLIPDAQTSASLDNNSNKKKKHKKKKDEQQQQQPSYHRSEPISYAQMLEYASKHKTHWEEEKYGGISKYSDSSDDSDSHLFLQQQQQQPSSSRRKFKAKKNPVVEKDESSLDSIDYIINTPPPPPPPPAAATKKPSMMKQQQPSSNPMVVGRMIVSSNSNSGTTNTSKKRKKSASSSSAPNNNNAVDLSCQVRNNKEGKKASRKRRQQEQPENATSSGSNNNDSRPNKKKQQQQSKSNNNNNNKNTSSSSAATTTEASSSNNINDTVTNLEKMEKTKKTTWPEISWKDIPNVTHKVLELLRNHDKHGIFAVPFVEENPSLTEVYLEVIPEPMDFRTIEKERIGTYQSINDLKKDLLLTFENCIEFNGKNSPLSSPLAIKLLGILDEIFCEASEITLSS